MKAAACAPIRIVSIGLAAMLLIAIPALPARAQANSVEVPSSNAAAVPSAGETGKSDKTGKAAKHRNAGHAEPKKKKNSFMNKIRDKALAKVQKLFGSKLEPKAESKRESNVE